MTNRQWVNDYIEQTKNKWTNISDFIWDHPELRYEEFAAAKHLSDVLENEGFTVTRGIAQIETAFVAQFGSGGPIIAFLGEYDALSNLSQKSGLAKQEPIVEQGHGHGCGHNLLGTGALAAAVTLKAYLEKNNMAGTVRFYGCPAEEGGSGKTFMAREGVFDDVDVALTWHPGPINAIWSFSSLANVQAYFKFTGKSAHAAAAPHLGRSALYAVELMNSGVNYLREHIIPEARVHYAVTDTGGTSPNVVQANAKVLYLVRAPQVHEAMSIYERVKKNAKGAALMTETEVEVIFDKAASNFIPNTPLNKTLEKAMQNLGAPQFTNDEFALAEQFQQTLSQEELARKNLGMKMLDFAVAKPLSDVNVPFFETKEALPGSTDVGDVSWVAPTAQCVMTTAAAGTAFHTWQMVAQGKTSYAHKGMLHVAKVLALTAIYLLEDENLINEAKKRHAKNVGPKGYQCPIPDHIQPNQMK